MHAPAAASGTDTEARLPGDPGLWVFIVADMMAFAVFFLVFTSGRVGSPALFEASRLRLDASLGLANTLVLLTSSMFMVRSVDAVRLGLREAAIRNLWLTLGIGSLFIVSKGIEWGTKFAHGVNPLTNEFFTYYFVFTGVHFLHFSVGIVALIVCLAKLRREPMDAPLIVWTEATGCYWHLVDLLWIVLFAMLYLLRAA